MPTYRTRTVRPAKKKARKYPKRLPRDPNKLFRWAARGTDKDYEKLRKLARKARNSLPANIDANAFERLQNVDRLRFIEEIQASEQHDVSAGYFLDGLNWLLDKVPWGNWLWPVAAAQTSINSMKGDGLNEVDEQYARLVGATYGPIDQRAYVVDHWKRQGQFDGAHVSVWDNPDGHRLIAVRGTQASAQDIGEDVLVGLSGRSTNAIGAELLQILAATPPGVVVDLAAHSLGTSLALSAYDNKTVYNAIHETYLFSPAYSPFVRGSTDAYERDGSVRYFINTRDVVSMGSFGNKAPSNVVFRSNIKGAHKLAQWQGHSAYMEPIMHAPPETRVHAHKAVFQSSAHEETKDEHLAGGVEQRESAPADVERLVEPPVQFDFGDVGAFDYEAL